MASRRELKKVINSELLDIIDSAYDYLEENPGEKIKEANTIIDGAVEALNEANERMSGRKSLSGKELREHFNTLKAEFDKKAAALRKQLDKL